MKLAIHLHIQLRSRMCGTIPPLPNTYPWRGAQLKAQGYSGAANDVLNNTHIINLEGSREM
jgi:hypothetical protein